jgi:choloylglycine hydrolase
MASAPKQKGHPMFRTLIAATLTGSLAFLPAAQACTGIQLTAKDGGIVAARTLEFGVDLKSEVVVIPAGTSVTTSLPGGAKGFTYTTKYGAVGANAFGLPVFLDAINDQGLYVGLFYFPGSASYPDATPENSKAGMSPVEYGAWLLGSFASVDEVKANYDKVALLPVIQPELGIAPPVHYVVHDRTGKSVVVEPVEKRLKIHDNPLGVLTNSPTFDWHMTNLSNYANLSAVNVPPLTLEGLKVSSFGQGSGMHGIPGDFTPPSRFVRAVAYSQAAIPSETALQSVLQAFHLLNNFDIPYGAVRDKVGGKTIDEYTLWTAASDLKTLKWHFRTFADQSIRSVDVKAALAAAGGKVRRISMISAQPIEDVSTKFVGQ